MLGEGPTTVSSLTGHLGKAWPVGQGTWAAAQLRFMADQNDSTCGDGKGSGWSQPEQGGGHQERAQAQEEELQT